MTAPIGTPEILGGRGRGFAQGWKVPVIECETARITILFPGAAFVKRECAADVPEVMIQSDD
jgi:hypothetical protein